MSTETTAPGLPGIFNPWKMGQEFVEAAFNCSPLAVTNYWSNYLSGLGRYRRDFAKQTALAMQLFWGVEGKRLFFRFPWENWELYFKLGMLNAEMFQKGFRGSVDAAFNHHLQQAAGSFKALFQTFFGSNGNGIGAFSRKQADTMKLIADFGRQIEGIEPEYGFHFGDGNYELAGETECFWLYQVLPFKEGKSRPDLVNMDLRPVVIIPPYVLGANILCFLRGKDGEKSYAHSFANQGVPTYIRIIKPINETPAVSHMTQEKDCEDTAQFCAEVQKRHGGKRVTLNGYCQGGYGAVVNWLSGELDDFVKAVMTCVAPMDGTFSDELKGFLDSLPPEFNDLIYGLIGSNGTKAASGQLMAWIYKLRAIGREAPIVKFYSDLALMQATVEKGGELSPSARALNYWLLYDRADIPQAITDISFASYNEPITSDGTLPVTLFGRKLNLGRFKEKGVPLVNFYAPGDDLVEPEVALAAEKWADHVEPLIGGHVKKATSPFQEEGGPERYHLSLN